MFQVLDKYLDWGFWFGLVSPLLRLLLRLWEKSWMLPLMPMGAKEAPCAPKHQWSPKLLMHVSILLKLNCLIWSLFKPFWRTQRPWGWHLAPALQFKIPHSWNFKATRAEQCCIPLPKCSHRMRWVQRKIRHQEVACGGHWNIPWLPDGTPSMSYMF